MLFSKKQIIILLLTSLVLKVVVALLVGQPLISDMATYHKLAQRLHNGFPLVDSYWPPGYPYFLAGIFLIFGENPFAVACIQAILATLTALFIYLSARLIYPTKVADISLIFFLFFIDSALYATYLYTQTLFVFLLVIVFWLATKDEERPRWWRKVLLGFVAGLTAYVKTVVFLPLLFLGIWSIIHNRERRKKILLGWLFAALTLIATLAPYTIYIYQKTGHFIIVHSNTGTNFYIGNNPNASGGYVFEDSCSHLKRPPNMDSYEMDSYFFKKALRFISENPGQALLNLPKKLVHLISLRGGYIPLLFLPLPKAIVILLTILSASSIAFLWFLFTFELCFSPKYRRGETAPLTLIWGFCTSLLIFFVGAPYVYLATPLMVMVASLGFIRLFRRIREEENPKPIYTVKRWIIFLSLWVLIIFSWIWEIYKRIDELLSLL